MRRVAVCALLTLAACGGGGGSAPAVSPGQGLVVNWVSRSGPSGGAGTQADPIHLAYPPLGVYVSVSRSGVAQQFSLTLDSSCTAVYVSTTSSIPVTIVPDPSSPGALAGGSTPLGLFDVSWQIVSQSKGTCTATVTTMDARTATLQVYSEL